MSILSHFPVVTRMSKWSNNEWIPNGNKYNIFFHHNAETKGESRPCMFWQATLWHLSLGGTSQIVCINQWRENYYDFYEIKLNLTEYLSALWAGWLEYARKWWKMVMWSTSSYGQCIQANKMPTDLSRRLHCNESW